MGNIPLLVITTIFWEYDTVIMREAGRYLSLMSFAGISGGRVSIKAVGGRRYRVAMPSKAAVLLAGRSGLSLAISNPLFNSGPHFDFNVAAVAGAAYFTFACPA